ncbi:MAG: SBBP repeat-containing protein [Candidatus Heimdallarchaeota archaeon]
MHKKNNLTIILILIVVGCGLFFSSNSFRGNTVQAISQNTVSNLLINEGDLPDHLNFSTFFGGSGNEYFTSSEDLGDSGVAVDSSGNIVIVGRTSSADFALNNAYQDTLGGGDYDAYVAKLSADGQSLIFATFLGGSGEEWATSVATCSNGDIVVVGTTMSTDFPTLNAYQTTNNGGGFFGSDIFLAKFSASGTLLFSTYFGGSGDDWGYGVAVDSSNRIAITGSTFSQDLPTANAFQSSKSAGSVDCYVSVFNSGGSSLVFSTFLGSTENDAGKDVIFDNAGNVVVVGSTSSTAFPIVNGYDSSYNGGAYDCLIGKFAIDGSIIFSTFLGGTDYDNFEKVAVDADDNIIAVGSTTSYRYTVTEDAFQDTFGGIEAGFFVILDSTGQSLVFSSFYSGVGRDRIYGVAVDAAGNIVFSGYTASNDLLTEQPYQSTYNGGTYDGFVCKLNSSLDLVYATYLGGSGNDLGQKIAITSTGNIIVSGYTASGNFPVVDAYQDTNAGSYDMYITRFNLNLTLPPETPTGNSTIFIAPLIMPFILFLGLLYKHQKRRK